jgi:HK97 gp10 family phage protein
MALVTRKQNWPKLLNELNDSTALGIRQTAAEIQAEAKNRVPVDTGALLETIRVEGPINGDPLAYEVVAGKSRSVEYAGFIEFGTRYMRAQPFLIPAFAKVDKLENIINQLNELIRKAQVR